MTTRSGTGVGELGCREVVEILGDYLEDAMAPHDRARLERHLADCDGCAAYLDQLRTTIRLSGRLPQEAVTEATMAPLLEAFRAWRREPYYRSDLALVHDLGFGAHAERCAPGVLALLEPVRRRRGLVLELGCGTGLLTRHLVDAGHRVLATDASPAMLARARRAVPGAEEIRQLVLPDDPLPRADAVVSVGHVVNYLPDLASVRSALVAMAGALRPGGVLAIDLCDLSYGQARRNSPTLPGSPTAGRSSRACRFPGRTGACARSPPLSAPPTAAGAETTSATTTSWSTPPRCRRCWPTTAWKWSWGPPSAPRSSRPAW